MCIFPISFLYLYVLHILFSFSDVFTITFCLFRTIYFIVFFVHFLISLLFKRSVKQSISIKHHIFSFIKGSDIFIAQSFRKIQSKKPGTIALLPYTRLSVSQDPSVFSYSAKYSGYSSIFFWRSLRNRPRCPVMKSSTLTSFGIPIIM